MNAQTRLDRYPRPNVAVDVAVLTVFEHELCVLVQKRPEAPRGHVLPGRFIRKAHTVEQTVQEVAELKLGVSRYGKPDLLTVLSDPQRDSRGWAISVAHTVTVPAAQLATAHGDWMPIDAQGEVGVRLLFDHEQIVSLAAQRIRDRYELDPDPDELLRAPFTLTELRRLHEAVLGVRVVKDTFNRRMSRQLREAPEFTVPTTTPQPRQVGRPARKYFQDLEAGPASSPTSDSLWRLPRAE